LWTGVCGTFRTSEPRVSTDKTMLKFLALLSLLSLCNASYWYLCPESTASVETCRNSPSVVTYQQSDCCGTCNRIVGGKIWCTSYPEGHTQLFSFSGISLSQNKVYGSAHFSEYNATTKYCDERLCSFQMRTKTCGGINATIQGKPYLTYCYV